MVKSLNSEQSFEITLNFEDGETMEKKHKNKIYFLIPIILAIVYMIPELVTKRIYFRYIKIFSGMYVLIPIAIIFLMLTINYNETLKATDMSKIESIHSIIPLAGTFAVAATSYLTIKYDEYFSTYAVLIAIYNLAILFLIFPKEEIKELNSLVVSVIFISVILLIYFWYHKNTEAIKYIITIQTYITQSLCHKKINRNIKLKYNKYYEFSPIICVIAHVGICQFFLILLFHFFTIDLAPHIEICRTVCIYLTLIIYEFVNADKAMAFYKDRI